MSSDVPLTIEKYIPGMGHESTILPPMSRTDAMYPL